MKFNSEIRLPKKSLVVALGLLVASTVAYGQSTTSSIFGQVPAQAGESIFVQSSSGLTRTVKVNSQGRYNANELPVGTYSVTLMINGAAVKSRHNVILEAGRGQNISFSSSVANVGAVSAESLSAVNVTANSVPPIDVSSVDSHTIITAEQLAKLPLARTAEAAALLAPGTTVGAGGAKSTTGVALVSFGGSATTENAYYINGFNTTDPNNAQGGITLPYGSVLQEEAYTGGYSAKYGRSDGGVISLIGKSGTNTWHFGGQVLYEPDALRSSADNQYYHSGLPPHPIAGNLENPYSLNTSTGTTYDAYVGGPLIKDRLFMFLSAEKTRSNGTSYGLTNENNSQGTHNKWYGNIDWNITKNSVLELTGASDIVRGGGSNYYYDVANNRTTGFNSYAANSKSGGHMWSAKFTDYLTDSLTLNALYGKMTSFGVSVPRDYNSDLTYISGTSTQNPAANGGVPILNQQPILTLQDPNAAFNTSNLRVSLSDVIGSHTISVGIDNLQESAVNQLTGYSGPGYSWSYNHTDHPELPLAAKLGVGALDDFANGSSGYYVTKNIANIGGGLTSTQNDHYIEDVWQVTDRWVVSMGLRDSQFVNRSTASGAQPYIRLTKPQWAPRLGFSWDVLGDSSFQVYGNAGRYYLSQPLGPGNVANAQTFSTQYFTYTGISADGTPTGLTTVSGPVDADNRVGISPNVNTLTARTLKAQDQDEFILGFRKALGPDWIYGAKITRRLLRHSLDDYCDSATVVQVAAAQGITDLNDGSCYYINPGMANTFAVATPSGAYQDVTVTNAEIGFPRSIRRYYGLDAFLEHPFDGHWYGKIMYTFSRLYGNTEGQGQSDIEATGGNQNVDWDFPQLEVYADGPQGNDHTNVIKAFGYYQLNPEWLVSANLSLTSGGPKYCLGLYGANPLDTTTNDPVGYGSNYHFCDGKPSPPGAGGRLPWMKQLDLGVQYRPAFADRKLGFHLDVFNVFNGQAPLNESPDFYADSSGTLNWNFGTPITRQAPRYVRMSVTYDY
jgi:hypothetical protein